MKKILLTLALVCAMTSAFAQTSDDKVKVYAILQAPGLLSSNPQIDYGTGSFEAFRTAEGKKAKSMAAALNYLAVNGWKVETTYTQEPVEHTSYSYVIVSKEVSKKEAEERANQGLK